MGFVINLKAETGLVDRSENTARFYKDVKDYKPFSKEEEVKWFTMLDACRKKMAACKKNGDKEEYLKANKEYESVRERIILCNQRLVIAAAKNYSTTDTLTDFISEINFGLIEAVDKYDVTKGVKFASYAMWYIIRAINLFKYGEMEMVQRSNGFKTFHVMSKARNKFIQENEREPTNDELLEILNNIYGKDIKDKNDLLDMNYSSIDLDTSSEDDGLGMNEIAEYNRISASQNDYVKKASDEFNSALISSLITVLNPKEKQIIEMRFGLTKDNGLQRELELTEVSDRIGISSERVRQLECSAIEKLRKEYERRIKKM